MRARAHAYTQAGRECALPLRGLGLILIHEGFGRAKRVMTSGNTALRTWRNGDAECSYIRNLCQTSIPTLLEICVRLEMQLNTCNLLGGRNSSNQLKTRNLHRWNPRTLGISSSPWSGPIFPADVLTAGPVQEVLRKSGASSSVSISQLVEDLLHPWTQRHS